MTEIFYDADADLGRLEGRAVAVLGYGNQGRTQALNMCDSGVRNVLVGNIRDESWEQAESGGFSPMPIREGVEAANICLMLVPDEVAPSVYQEEHVEPALTGKDARLRLRIQHRLRPHRTARRGGRDHGRPRMIGEALRSLFSSRARSRPAS